MERCYLQKATYAGCGLVSGGAITIDIEDPATAPNAHFTYDVAGADATSYTVTALRNTRDGGVATDAITYTLQTGSITRQGTTRFASLN